MHEMMAAVVNSTESAEMQAKHAELWAARKGLLLLISGASGQ